MAKKRHKGAPKAKKEAPKHHDEDHNEQHHHVQKKQVEPSYWKYATVIFALISVFLVVYITQGINPGTGAVGTKDIDVVAQDTVEYINNYLLGDGTVAELKNATIENGLYKLELDISGQSFESYVSTDGEVLFPSAVALTNLTKETQGTPQEEQPADVPKTDKPVVNVFVMSYCPYGLQMEKAFIPVMDLLGDKADINIDYVNYIMHGEKEMIQNNHQHCIEEEQSDKFVEYLRCFVQSDDHETCAADAGIDMDMLDACVARIDEEYNITGLYQDKSTWSGGSYPPYNVDAVAAIQYGVRGSPTVVINGKTVSVSRSPEAVKTAVCAAFNTPPSECGTKLSTAQEGTGIGPLGSGDSSSGTASCE